ncbi:MAG TPA: DUF368 domain-containing protein [Verrucomicrobiales bacterium]|nr:DUF368 domain-containing protein [Verrucomicrobiales bacterium]
MNLWEDWNLLQSKSEKSMSGNPEKKPFFDKTSLPRTILGGAAMGIANIIPGVSGGTMVLAFGLYEKFVNSVAAVTRFKFTLPVISFLCIFGVSAVIAIFTSADVITWGLTYHQHIMFALFIGLTLGGVPTLCREMGRFTGLGTGTAMAGFISILVINSALSEIDLPANFLFLFLGGIIGSAAMVLPGISGSYLLLILGLYIPMTEGWCHDGAGIRSDFTGWAGCAHRHRRFVKCSEYSVRKIQNRDAGLFTRPASGFRHHFISIS